jgi:hypothetical protein
MKSLHNVAVLVAMVALLGSIGMGASLQQQAFAQGVIVNYKEQFNKLSEQFQQDVLDLVSSDPPSEVDPPTSSDIDDIAIDPGQLATLFDNYERETFRIFGADPPRETEPPDPDTEPPDPDIESPTR